MKIAEITTAVSIAGIAAIGFGFVALVILDNVYLNQIYCYYYIEEYLTYI